MGFRKGDNAPLALVTLLDRPDSEAPATGGDEEKGAKKKAKKTQEAAAS